MVEHIVPNCSSCAQSHKWLLMNPVNWAVTPTAWKKAIRPGSLLLVISAAKNRHGQEHAPLLPGWYVGGDDAWEARPHVVGGAASGSGQGVGQHALERGRRDSQAPSPFPWGRGSCKSWAA